MEARVQRRKADLEALLGRPLEPVAAEAPEPISDGDLRHLLDQAADLFWNELEWENLMEEERLGEDLLVEQAFPGFLAFVRGLLLTEVMPDALAGAQPRPRAVQAILDFLAGELDAFEAKISGAEADDVARLAVELGMTRTLLDLVMGQLYGLTAEEMEDVRASRSSG